MMTGLVETSSPSELRRPRLLPPARWLFRRQLEIVIWFWALVLLVFGIAFPAISRAGGDLPFSIWENFAAHGPAWFVFSIGATAVTGFLPMMVASGMTRARFTLATTLSIVACALLMAALVAAGFRYEEYAFGAFGWQHSYNGAHVFASSAQVHLVVAEYLVRYLLFGIIGLLAGHGFYRAGGWWGTALLAFTVVLPLGIGSALLNVTTGRGQTLTELAQTAATGLGVGAASPMGLGLTLAYAVALVIVARALLSTVPIRARVN